MTSDTMLTAGAVLLALALLCFRNSLASFGFTLLVPKPLKEWVRNIATKQFVRTQATGITEDFLAGVATQIAAIAEEERAKFFPKLRAENAKLREENDLLKNGWIDFTVCVKGFDPDPDHVGSVGKFFYGATVQLSRTSRQYRAHPDKAKRKMFRLDDGMGYPLSEYSDSFPPGSQLYSRVNGDPKKLVLFGETYYV